MSLANPLWGAPRIHGELLKIGIDVGTTKRSIVESMLGLSHFLMRLLKNSGDYWKLKTTMKNITQLIPTTDKASHNLAS